MDLWPRVDSSDIHEFLVPRMSLKTREQMKSKKALEGHNFLKSGWLWELWVNKFAADTVIVVTQCVHNALVDVWFVAKSDDEILATHCTCIAGNSEACSHPTALLFYVKHEKSVLNFFNTSYLSDDDNGVGGAFLHSRLLHSATLQKVVSF
ncbi:hypothetical protein HPB51_016714 [Rhipicephalus microplus]|uniref:SWIM-type domain-containing protein n=1 Tax=Rhipicephalus microplus TaxID=6941 RepID=A0A9J6DAD1_RHIMP|nr:hypothetical protein HPB51_016714 [Rhipicephalus microplus]